VAKGRIAAMSKRSFMGLIRGVCEMNFFSQAKIRPSNSFANIASACRQ
jgi:hypothetical protein